MDIEKIKEELKKEFEWDGPPLALHALKKTLGSFLKQEFVLGWKASRFQIQIVSLFHVVTHGHGRSWKNTKLTIKTLRRHL